MKIQLRTLITDAFPLERGFHNSELLLPGNDAECEEEVFTGSQWWDLHTADLISRTFILHYFTPTAFCYFLPAYLLASIEISASGLTDAIMDRVSPPKNDTSRPSFQEWWGLLSKEQRRSLIETMRYHVKRGNIIDTGACMALETVLLS